MLVLSIKIAAIKFVTKSQWLIIKATKSHKWKRKAKISLLNKKVKLKNKRKLVVFGHTLRLIILKIRALFAIF